MVTIDNRKIKNNSAYRMTEEERIEITNKLKEAILLNNSNPQKNEWDSNTYRNKYGL